MVHIVGQKPTDSPKNFMFFNVDKPVGANAAGALREDVLLVQFFLQLLGFRNQVPNGNNDQTTIEQIRAYQTDSFPAPYVGTADGRVSVATGFRYAGGHYYTIVMMNSQVRPKPNWPLIHKMPGCPGELITAVQKLF